MRNSQQLVIAHIPFGAENAVQSSLLAAKTGFDDRVLREIIESIIADEIVPICSSCTGVMGYFRPTSREEMNKYHRQLSNRAGQILKRLHHSKKMMRRDFPAPWDACLPILSPAENN